MFFLKYLVRSWEPSNCDIHLLVDDRDSYIVVLKGGNQRFFPYSSNNIMVNGSPLTTPMEAVPTPLSMESI